VVFKVLEDLAIAGYICTIDEGLTHDEKKLNEGGGGEYMPLRKTG
jgi:hypothetical protein